MQQYLKLLDDTLKNGRTKQDRTGTGTISVFGTQTHYSLLGNKLPMVTTKKLFSKGVIHELLWMLRGETNIESLTEENVNIWNEWADANGNLGPVYGEMWRRFPNHAKVGMGVKHSTVDQIKALEEQLEKNPNSRRMLISGWHPGLLPNTSKSPSENASAGLQALPPCHTLFQFICEPMTLTERFAWIDSNKPFIGKVAITVEGNEDEIDGRTVAEDDELAEVVHRNLTMLKVPEYFLSCQLYQRSADLFLGVPFNIMSYSLLTHMLAEAHNMVALNFVHTIGDAHIYLNHVEQVKKQLGRTPKALPTVRFNEEKDYASVLDFEFEDIEIIGYKSHPAIKGEVAV